MVSPHCMIRLLLFAFRFNHGIVALYHQRHAHDTAYLPHTWAFYLRPHSFSRSTSLSFFSLCAYTVLILRTKYCLVGGIQFNTGSLRWKKGGRCTAFATRHEEHLSQMERDTTTHLFRPMLGVKTCPGVVGRVMDFSFGLDFRFFFDVFFFTRFIWLAISADFLTLYSPLVVSYSGLMKLR